MKSYTTDSLFARLAFAIAGFVFAASAAAQGTGTGTGTIEGRVFDAGRGEYLEKARLTIEGTGHEAFTDEGGFYRLTNVSAGTARVHVFFTGLPSQTATVNVIAGQTSQHDITLTSSNRPTRAEGEPIKLDSYVVSTTKEMDGAAIAINEQRFARNIMSVVAADEFGTVVDGTPGEVMKYLPGITMEYSAGEARTVSMNGVPSTNVPITVGGFDLASAASNGTGRNINLDQFSVNSISRIEVMHSPTPESPGSALAGSVNMVPRSAFERSRPSFNTSLFLVMKDGERSIHETAGPLWSMRHKITPGFNFSAVVPVNKRFGFTLSGNTVDQYSYENVAVDTWRGVGSATNVAATATNGLPDTTPDKPYLSDFAVRDSTRDNRTDSLGATVDLKPSMNDTVSVSFQWTWIGVQHNNRTLTFLAQRVLPGNWGPTFTHGAPGGYGRVNVQGAAQDWLGTTSSPSIIWRHRGRTWRSEAGAGLSRASLHVRSADKGYFHASQASRTGVIVSFDDIYYLRPLTISVTDPAGNPVSPYDLNNFSMVNADDNPRDSVDLRRNAFANLRRDLAVADVPVSVKGGVDVRSTTRDLRANTRTFSYVGPDHKASTTPVGNDDTAGVILDERFSQRPGRFGLPNIQWIDNQEYYQIYKAHPDYFTIDENAYEKSKVTTSKFAREIISAGYLRGDASFFRRRLQVVGGVRVEQTNIKAAGPLIDPTLNYQRAADGTILRDPAGKPLLIVPTTDAVGVTKQTYVDRGKHINKEYLRWFPSLNVSYNLRENLIVRGSYYYSVGRPDFNEYAGGLTLPDVQSTPSSSNRITINNPDIKAWTARTAKVRFEYYFERVGQISIGAFHRDFTNFFGSQVFNAAPEFLQEHGLDPTIYDPYDVTLKYNVPGHVIMTGLEFEYKQALTFLPQWARGVQVFANSSALRATGDQSSNFAGFIPRTYNWGASLTRPKYLVRVNWNYRGAQRRGIVAAGRSIDPDTYNWGSKRLYIDVTGEYNFRRHYTLFANLRNINNATEDTKIYGPNTPTYARFRQRVDYGAAWTFGIRGSF